MIHYANELNTCYQTKAIALAKVGKSVGKEGICGS